MVRRQFDEDGTGDRGTTAEADDDGTDGFLIGLNQKLLNAIVTGDYATYEALCDTDMTCFEPECEGHLVQGLPFHKFFFDAPAPPAVVKGELQAKNAPPATVTMSGVHVRRLGTTPAAAVVSYVRINQKYTVHDGVQITKSCETRVWEQNPHGEWKNVHVHRS